ncbi:MAG: alpha/beta fold hydrolase [Burkholderiales bacterium]|nr:alpha/beta fold hydrolase [Burkholderiales bacterium]
MKINQARSNQTYWHCYHDPALLARVLAVVQTRHLQSTGVELHIDLYQQRDKAAPVLILNHGGGGYGGLFVGLALAFYEQGYTVIVPDQKGQGRSGGAMGDFTVAEAVQNIVDVAAWARQEFSGSLYLCGGSIGGGLAYAAAAAMATLGKPPVAAVCLNLFDFGDPVTGLAFTRFAVLAKIPRLARAFRAISGLLAKLAPRMRLPYRPLARFENMMDERDLATGFYAKWQADPLTLRTVTARYFASMLDQKRDKMVNPQLTRDCYERLSGQKAYAEIDWGHFSLQPEFNNELIILGKQWLKEITSPQQPHLARST